MKLASCTAAALLALAAPAIAVPALECTAPGQRGFEMIVSVGSAGGVDLVRITEGGREMVATGLPGANPRIARGFLDDAGRLTLRIVGADGRTLVASLDAPGYAGILRYRGRDWRVSCRWEQAD